MKHAVLIVDDEQTILATLSRALRVEHYDVEVAGSGAIALEKLAARSFDAVLLDISMPGMTGLEVLRSLRDLKNDVPVIMMSGHGTVETAMEATRLGAHDFIEKPVGTDRLLLSLGRALEFDKLSRENQSLKEAFGATDGLLGDSPRMTTLREQIRLAASASASVLIEGERGTGKELIAKAIHAASRRARGPLEKLNCAAVPAELIESELFGHEAGAFTGATKQRRGKFERASDGTLFLDEVGDMPAPMQAKLLRVLQEGEIERVGGSALLRVDVRVVAATNKNLSEEVRAGRFRADLYDRLNVLPLRVPALRDRAEDISFLAKHFLALSCRANDRPLREFTQEGLHALSQHDFPGNVRELRNLVERLVILSQSARIGAQEVRAMLGARGDTGPTRLFVEGQSLRTRLDELEKQVIVEALAHYAGHVTKTAVALGLERSHLYKKMKSLGVRGEAQDDET